MKEDIKQLTTLTDKEFYMVGRIPAHQIPNIIKTRIESSFHKKLHDVASRSTNSDYLLRNEGTADKIRNWLKLENLAEFYPVGIVFDIERAFLCCSLDGKQQKQRFSKQLNLSLIF